MKTTIAIVGAGNLGIATAYYLVRHHNITDVLLIDKGQPMSYTSAQSGENYRNWWPNSHMMAFADRSIDLFEEISKNNDNRINMTRRGYFLATRSEDYEGLLSPIRRAVGEQANSMIRVHNSPLLHGYKPPFSADWREAPSGFDLLSNPSLIHSLFPHFDPSIRHILHVRRGGDISAQQLGQHMLEHVKSRGVRLLTGTVENIVVGDDYTISVMTDDQSLEVRSERLVNAAGPFAGEIAKMLDVDLPIYNVMQQKISFPDVANVIPRHQPFTIDTDAQNIDWTDEERELLRQDPEHAWVTETMSGGIHCRPDGGDNSNYVKLGWAYNSRKSPTTWEVPIDERFPEIVLRGAARLNPGLKVYYDGLPRGLHHYGGWYTRTSDNLPLIGPMGPKGAYMICALSGHGTMTACSAGELAAAWVNDAPKKSYADAFSLARYKNISIDAELDTEESGLL